MRRRRGLKLVFQSLDYSCGAACFASMIHELRGDPIDEERWISELGTKRLGFTPPEDIVATANHLGLDASLQVGVSFADLSGAFQSDGVVFVTWWNEDSGHYSLVEELDAGAIVLMDPWDAREGLWKTLSVDTFLPLWIQRGAKMIRVLRR